MSIIILLFIALIAYFSWIYFKKTNQDSSETDVTINPVSLKMELIINYTYSAKAKDALLARFKNGQVILDLAEYWDQKLGANRLDIMNEFLQKGLIMPMPNGAKLESVFSLIELKAMCQEYGLKISGKKIELAERLFSANQKTMEELVSEIKLMCLTKAGSDLVNKYYEKQTAEYSQFKTQILEHLNDGNLTDAIRVSHLYKSNMLWPNGFDEGFDMDFLSGALSSPLGNKDERFEAALIHLLPKS